MYQTSYPQHLLSASAHGCGATKNHHTSPAQEPTEQRVVAGSPKGGAGALPAVAIGARTAEVWRLGTEVLTAARGGAGSVRGARGLSRWPMGRRESKRQATDLKMFQALHVEEESCSKIQSR
ncbi:hypothetical protein BRADI_5g25205v3 [Brachypodium distachyon]|uniref:Uncharacterized protein n=1 Tax=Brachypodium distachyon TaxID=15368 RepID=A0A2K2CJ81_BRADI|nr:hypothetical protein BRADI_5g25205v3 [Brachypodium distachyon]